MNARSITLVYYSPTGTTRRLLHAMANGLAPDSIEEIDLTTVASRQRDEIAVHGDMAIIGVPVYEERVPPVVEPLLPRLRGRGQPAVVVAVYGNVGPGIVLPQLSRACEVARLHVVAGATLIGEHSFCHDALGIARGRPDQADIAAATGFGTRVKQCLASITGLHAHQSPSLPGKLPAIARLLPRGIAKKFTASPRVDASSCTRCGACVVACPAGAIDPGSLVINEKTCTRCFACVRACKDEARSITLKHSWLVRRFLGAAIVTRREPRLFL